MSEMVDSSQQGLMAAAKSFLADRHRDLAPAACDNHEYHAILEALEGGTATPTQVIEYLLSRETRRRIDSSGVEVNRYGELVVGLSAVIESEGGEAMLSSYPNR